MRYAVRCCCCPRKVLGWLDGPEGVREWMIGEERIKVREIVAHRRIVVVGYDPATDEETIELEPLDPPEVVERAVYSEDRPHEFWERLPGFEPAT